MKKRYIGFLSALVLSAGLLLSGCGEKGLNAETVAEDPFGYVKAGSAVISETWNTEDSVLLPLLGSLAEAGEGQIDFTAEPGDGALEGRLAFDAEMLFAEANGELALGAAEEHTPEKKPSEKGHIKTDKKSTNDSKKNQDKKIKRELVDASSSAWLDGTDFVLQSELLLGTKDAHGFALERFLTQGAESDLAKAIGLTDKHTAALSALPEAEEPWPVLLQTVLQKMETAETDFWALFEGAEAVVTEETVTIEDAEVDAIAVTMPMPEAWASSAETAAEQDCVFYLNKKTGVLMQVDIYCNTAEVKTVRLLFGEHPEEIYKLGLEVDVERAEDTITFTGELKKSRTDKTDRYDLNLYLALNDGTPVNFGVLYFHNTGTDAYMLQLTSTEGDRTKYFFELRGGILFREDGMDLTVHTMKINDVAVECAVEAQLRFETELPDKPAYRDLLNAEAEVLETLGQFVDLTQVDELVSTIRTKFEEEIQGLCFKCYKDAKVKVHYLGEDWLCCKTCAKEIAKIQKGSFCDSCWNETEDLTTADIYGAAYRLCPDCYLYHTSY